ncbi:plasmid recombination protein [Paratractidigestivibacter sp.]|uniref:plasmid recombination protein n=1 Tax=Paratractidigestivibacter sp. TaxID=2847316 RepID=UPI004025C8BA
MAYSTADILKGKKDGEGGGIEGYDTEQTRCLAEGERWHKAGIPAEFEGQRVAVIYNKVAGSENVKGSVTAAVAARLAECPQKKKIRKDAVRYLVARANMPDYSSRSAAERDEWVKRVRGFFAKRYGKENVVDVRWHFDQTTPHLHLTVVPITKDGRLSAKDVFKPTKANMRRWQKDWFAEVAGPMGYEEPDFGRSQEKGYTRECVASRRQAEAAKKKTVRVVAAAAKVEKAATERAVRAGKAATEAETAAKAAEAQAASLAAERARLDAEAAAAKERTQAAAEAATAAEERAVVATFRASEAEKRLERLQRAARVVAQSLRRAKAEALRSLRTLARRCWGGANRPPTVSNAVRIAVNSNKAQVVRGISGYNQVNRADRPRTEVHHHTR